MDSSVRLKVLARMARSETEIAKITLQKEIDAAVVSLENETDYGRLEQSLATIKTIGFRLSEVAVGAVIGFIKTIEGRTLTYSEDALMVSALKNYRTAEALLDASIDTLTVLRYWQTREILRALIELSEHGSERIRKKARTGLELLSQYDIEIFYGDKEHPGLGPAPQRLILQELERLNEHDVRKYLSAVLALLEHLLSPEMEGTKWSYHALTLTRMETPGAWGVQDIRRGSIVLLKSIYHLAQNVKDRLRVIGALTSATRTARKDIGEEARRMFVEDSTVVLEFLASLSRADDLQIVQKIEHNSYWIHYHAIHDDIRQAALHVKEEIARNDEYQIYRNLIGFEGIFGDWDELHKRDDDPEGSDTARRAKADEYVKSIDANSYGVWRHRILSYARTESDDLATFPVFYYFLEKFASAQPKLALRLLEEDAQYIDRFLIPILRGVWDGQEKPSVTAVLKKWTTEGRYLYASTKLFLSTKDLDLILLRALLEKAIELNDLSTIRQVIAVAIVRHAGEDVRHLVLKEFFFEALDVLTQAKDTSWIHEASFRDEARKLLGELESAEVERVLKNLRAAPKIDYHAEVLLSIMAQREPERIIEFFIARIAEQPKTAEDARARDFEPVPFKFHKLQEVLSKSPHATVEIVLAHHRVDSSLFEFRAARLLHNIFPTFSEELEAELLRLVHEGGTENYEFVLGILKTYHGELVIHRLCKEIVKSLPEDSPLRTDVAIVLESTGMVSGEFGMSDAYERKRKEVLEWLSDPDDRIRSFAEWYISDLEKLRDGERKRAEESIALRKFRYREG